MEYSNPDPDLVRRAAAPAASPTTSTRGGDAATQIGATSAKLAGVTDGVTSERLGGEAVAIRQRVSAVATAAAAVPMLRGEISRAYAAFAATAPTPEQMRAAEKAAMDTAAASTAANEAADAPGATQADQTAADDAGKAAADAKDALAKLRKQRDDARRALFEVLRAVAKKVKEIKVGGDRDQAGTGGGYGSGNGKGTGTTAGAPAGSPAATAPGTSRSTPAMPTVGQTNTTATPGSTKTSGTAGSGDPSALLSQLGQQAQQPQAQQVAAQPQAAAQVPQQATQPQQGKQDGKDGKHSLAADGVLSTDDIARMIGENTGPALTTAYAPGASSPISAANGITTQYRPSGTPIQGTTAGGTSVQTPPAPNTGTSVEGLNTKSDISGRSEPARTAFTATPAGAETRTSADHTGQGQGTAGQGRPGAGMPMGAPMAPMMGGPLSSPAASNPKGERTPVTAYPDKETYHLHGGDTISESVPGGTIAQNKPSRDDPRRRAA